MCWPWSHKWRTVDTSKTGIWETSDNPDTDLPIRIDMVVQQECMKCGKRIVRTFKI